MKVKTLNTKRILKNSFEMIYDAGLYLLLFELIYKGLMLVLFKPVLNVIVSMFIRASGYEILVNGEISQFLLSFTGILMVVVVMSVSVALVYYEFSVILLILDSSKKKEGINLLQITEKALLKIKSVIKNRQIGLALYILVLIPILNIGIQSSLLPALSIPDFITGELAKYPGSEILFFLLTIALVYLFAKLFLALPVMVFSDKSFTEASKISFKTIKGEGFKIAFLIIAGMIIWVMLTYLPFMVLENAQFILLRILRGASNISMTIFTLLISPFILSISLESYNSYINSESINREETSEKIELGYFGKKFWKILEITLDFVQALLSKARDHKKVFITLTLALIIVSNIYAEESVRPIYDQQLLIGHRGGEYGVENTIDTLLFAGTNGADYVEMDVLLTKDNIPVVIHDNNLKRLGSTSTNISDLTLEEVKKVIISAGDKKDSIPSLEELSRAVKGKTKLLLEFKTHGKEKVSIVDKTIEILKKEGILEETIFHTSEGEIIKEFNDKYEELTMGYVFIGKIGTFSAKKMAKMPVDFISAEESLINKNMIREVHKAGKAVFAWTINDDYKAKRLLELGVDALITDYPVEMVELRDKYKDYNEF
ncbi:MAG: hypothetical protein GX046_03185 [Tissierellia bacterium]|nr:hypothetical protein [Tissierellia bacterium]